MKTYKFKNINNTESTFHNTSSINYSKILDDLIYADIMEKNYYLDENPTTIKTTGDKYLDKMIGIGNTGLKDNFTSAITYIKSFKTKKPAFEYGKIYKLHDGTPIIFFEDSIQIGFKLYYYNDFDNYDFLSTITPELKKTIITIYIDGLKITIKK